MDLQHEIRIDDIVEALDEDGQKTEACEKTGQSWHDPVNRFFVSRPAKPKETKGEEHAANHDRWQAPFRNWNTTIGLQLLVVGSRIVDDVASNDEYAHNHAEKGQTCHTGGHMMYTLEYERIGCEEAVEEAVNERHVECDEQDDRFGNQQSNRTRKILSYEFSEIDLNLFLLRMNAPILSSAAQFLGFVDQNYWGVSLR